MKNNWKINDLPKIQVFRVPEKYFEELPEEIWARISTLGEIRLSDIPKESVFQIPANYFAQLPDAIQKKIMEWNGLHLADIPKLSVFSVPSNYFEQLPEQIQAQILALLPKTLENLPKKEVFEVPADFFENLTQKILQKSTLSESLENLSKESVFATPDNYFENLPTQIQQKIWATKAQSWFWQSQTFKRWALTGGLSVVLLGMIWWNWQNNSIKSNVNDLVKIEQKSKINPKENKTTVDSLVADNELVTNKEMPFENKNTLANEKNLNVNKNIESYASENHSERSYLHLEAIPRQEILAYLEQEDVHDDELMDMLAMAQAQEEENILLDLHSEDDLFENADKLDEKLLNLLKNTTTSEEKKDE